jgi:integrase
MPLLLVRRAGSPNWWLQGTVRGIKVYESTKIADLEAAETIRIVRERELVDESIFGKKINATFEEAATAYLNGGGSTRFLSRLTNLLGHRPLRSINQSDIDSIAKLLHPTAALETRNRQCYTPFIAVWNCAVDNDWAELRRWKRPRKLKGTTARKLSIRSGDRPVEYELAAGFVSNMSPAPAMVMTALFYTGMRPIELFTLEPDDVDVENRWITLRHTKSGEPRGVPIHEFLVPLFASLKKRRSDRFRQLIRSYRGLPYHIHETRGGQLHGALRGTRKRMADANNEISKISPYTARHTVSTQLVINGVHSHIKDQILGHAVDDMSRRYTQVPRPPLIEAINTLPVPQAWRDLHWWDDPLTAVSTHVKWGRK